MKKRKRKEIIFPAHKMSFIKKIIDGGHKDISSHLVGINFTNIQRMHKIFDCLIKSGNLLLPSTIKVIDKDKQIKPFWNEEIKQLSKKLFMPSKKNIIKSNTIPRQFSSDTWFDYKEHIPKIGNQLNKEFQIGKSKLTNKTKKTLKIQIVPSYDQKYYLKQIIGTYRYFYNRAVSYINNYQKKNKKSFFYIYPNQKKDKISVECKDTCYFTYHSLRRLLKNNYPDWILPNFNSHLIDQAFIECYNRFKTCLSNYAKNHIPFEFKFKNKRTLIQTINMEKTMARPCNGKTINIFKNWKLDDNYYLRKIKIKEYLPENFSDFSLSHHTVLDKYYLNVPYNVDKGSNESKDLCAIDQGVITPFVVYTPNYTSEIGNNCYKTLLKKCREVDIIKSRMSKKEYYVKKDGDKVYYSVNSKRKKQLREALHRKLTKIKNMKNELHNKTINHLTTNFGGVILPPFEIQKMASNLHSKVAQSMYNLSFYKFKTKLKAKANEMNVKIYEFTEPYTSQTCGNCGLLNKGLGNSRLFSCQSCNLKIDRDINGARNIFLRNLGFVKKIPI